MPESTKMNPETNPQKKLFDILSRRNTKDHQILYDVMELLDIKKGAAYKRMNGETSMPISEVIKLADHYNLSLDATFRSDKYISFFHPFVHKQKSSLQIFIDQYKKFFKPLEGIDSDEQVHLTYLANELPIFYYFGHKYIFNFMISVWKHLHWDDVNLEVGNAEEYEQEGKEIRNNILNNYYKHEVTEIWNSNMLNNLYQQIIFSITIRAFKSPNYIPRLMNDIENLILHLRDISIKGTKSIKGAVVEGSELKIYLNDFGNYLNIVQFDSRSVKSSFLGYDYPQFIVSHNKPFFQFSKDWINRLKKRSVLISSEGYQYRELFFLKMEADYQTFKARVEKLMDVYYPDSLT